MSKYIMALDQGTTSSRCILFDKKGQVIAMAQKDFLQIYPKNGWVEHNAMEIWDSQLGVAREAMAMAGASHRDIVAIGIANQRETTVVWNRKTGLPIYNAIVWQCRRTAGICDELKSEGWSEIVKDKTGLVIDAYFSGTKIKWLLDQVPGARALAQKGELLFGTIDTWLIYKLTKGKVHATDYSNASRTMLYNIYDLKWDDDILKRLDIPFSMLPEVYPSSCVYGHTDEALFGGAIPISGAAGDQQAALFGQCCFAPGTAKNTYGTGCFLLMNTSETAVKSHHGLLTTIAWGQGGKVEYALEGSVFMAGAAVQWLRDEMGLIQSAAESEVYALKVPDTAGVYVVPAFVGLGAPHWDAYARGSIAGLTRSANKSHIIRATLESIAYQTYDVLKAMQEDSRITLKTLKVDGGACANNFLMQFQADITGAPVERPSCIETTAMGAAYFAGLAIGYWKDRNDLLANGQGSCRFEPNMPQEKRTNLVKGWHKAVERAKGWEDA